MGQKIVNKQPFHERRYITSKEAVGIAMVLGVVFSLISYLASYSASFVWDWQKTHGGNYVLSGGIALIAFLMLLGIILWIAKKYLR